MSFSINFTPATCFQNSKYRIIVPWIKQHESIKITHENRESIKEIKHAGSHSALITQTSPPISAGVAAIDIIVLKFTGK
jgi:hypothetical protein